MRRVVKILLLGGILAIVLYLGIGISGKIDEQKRTDTAIVKLPDVAFKTLDGNVLSQVDLTDKPLWLVFFDTTCEYCQMEVDNIKSSQGLKNVQIWMVSSEQIGTLEKFAREHGLIDLPYVKLLNDSSHAATGTFHVNSTPTSFLYRSDGALIKQYKGVVRVETILNDLEHATGFQ